MTISQCLQLTHGETEAQGGMLPGQGASQRLQPPFSASPLNSLHPSPVPNQVAQRLCALMLHLLVTR